MKRTTYTDLFEDEVAEILRNLPHGTMVIMDAWHEFYPASMICEDGVYTSGAGMFTEYFRGKRTGHYVNQKYLIDTLSHKTFTVVEKEA